MATFLSFGLIACNGTEPQLELAGQWSYALFEGYESLPYWEDYADPEGGLVDAISINTIDISGNDYLILNFPALASQNNSRIFIFDANDPFSPGFVSSIALEKQEKLGLQVNSVAISENILYGGLFGDRGLWMVDISDPFAPVDLGIAPLEMTSNLVISGSNACAVGQLYNGISIADVTDTKNVRQISRMETASRECRIAVSGNLLVIGNGQMLTLYDISTPTSPEQVGTCELEVSEPLVTEAPFPVPGIVHWANWANILDIDISGNYVYVTFGAGQVRIVDVSVPSAPEEVAEVNPGGFAIALTIEDDYLYVTGSHAEDQKLQLTLVDISEPGNPRVIDSISTESMFAFGGASFAYCWARPQVIGDYIYLAGLNYLDVIKFNND